MESKKRTKLGKGLISGLKQAAKWQQGKLSLNSTDLEIPDEPPVFKKAEVKEIRTKIFKMSQPLFAKYIGVSSDTVKAWESGRNPPSGSSARILQMAKAEPQKFTQMMLQATR